MVPTPAAARLRLPALDLGADLGADVRRYAGYDSSLADDFGPDGWQEPLDVLSSAYRCEAGLSRFGTVSIHAQLVQILTNRLLLEDLVRRRPEVLHGRVEAPIVLLSTSPERDDTIMMRDPFAG